MSKFCTKCGSPLKDGKCENCDKEKEVKETKKVEKEEKVVESKEETVNIESNNAIGADLVAIYKNSLTKPFSTIKAIYDTANAKLAWILIAVSSAITGLVTYFLAKKVVIGIIKTFANKAMSAAAIAGELGSAVAGNEINQGMAVINQQISSLFGTIFMTGFISMALYYIIYALISKVVVGNIFKGKETVTEYLLVVAGASNLYTIFAVASLVLSFITWKLAMLAIILGFMVFVVATLEGYSKLLGAKKEKLCYAFAVTLIVATIIYYIATGIVVGSMWKDKINQLTYTTSAPQTSLFN